MDALCGSGELGSKFWDSNLSVHTDNPDLTPCFQNSLLAWAPCVYLWAALPCYLFYLRRHHRGYIVLSRLSRLKTALGVLLWCISWADLFYSFHGLVHGWAPAPIFFVTPLVVGVTMLLATLLIQYERLQGVQSSGVLIIFWFLCVLCAIIPFRSKILSAVEKGKISDPFRFSTFYIYFALVLSALILSCFREKPPLFSPKDFDTNPCPETKAGFLSRLSFWWFTKMAILGYKRPLELQDLWSLNKEDRSQMVVQRLLGEWKKQQEKAVRHQAAEAAGKRQSSEGEVLLGGQHQAREPSFLRALLATFSSSFLLSMCFKLIQDLLSFVNPQLLRSSTQPFLGQGASWLALGTTCRGKSLRSGTEVVISTFSVTSGKWQSLCRSGSQFISDFHLLGTRAGSLVYMLANVLSLNPPNSPAERCPYSRFTSKEAEK